MPLFPLSSEHYDEPNRHILQRMESFYTDSITTNQSYWSEADSDCRFEAGDQQVWNDFYGNLPASRRRQFNFNRIRRIVQMISGHQRRNRTSITVVPVENADEMTADQFTKILMWINQQEGVLNTVSDAFHGSLVSGMNLLQVWVDYRNDPISGNIKVDNCAYNSFLIDPFFRKADLSDCNGLWKRSFLNKREVRSLLPDHAEDIDAMTMSDSKDSKFQFLPENYNYSTRNLLSYDEFYYRDYRKQKMLADTQTGELLEWKATDEDALKAFLQAYPSVNVIYQDVPTVNLAIVVQGRVMYDGPNPLGIDTYPFVPVFSYFNPQVPYFPIRIQGVVRGLRDSQYLYNRRKIIELDILESQLNSGYIYKENALVNPKDVFQTGQGKGIALKETAQMGDVMPIQSPAISPTTLQVSESMGREMMEISGVNEELLGSATDDKAGILAMLRQGSGLTTLQSLFDQLDHSQKLLGRIMLQVVQNNFTPGKVKRILNEEPAPQFYNKNFGFYDAAIEDGINTTTQRQLQFAQLLHMREIGVPIPDAALIEAATLQDKSKLIKDIEDQQKSQAEQQRKMDDAQLQFQLANTKLSEARATADTGLGIERMSRIEDNKAMAEERRAKAEADLNSGTLDMIKSLKELDSMDVQNLEKLVNLALSLKNDQKLEAEGLKSNQKLDQQKGIGQTIQ
jgi:hypothetical protein